MYSTSSKEPHTLHTRCTQHGQHTTHRKQARPADRSPHNAKRTRTRHTERTTENTHRITREHRKAPTNYHVPTTHTAHCTHSEPRKHKRAQVYRLVPQCLLSVLCHIGANCSVALSQGGSPQCTVDCFPSKVWHKALLRQCLTLCYKGILTALL